MIIKSYEVKKNISNFSKHNFFLLYGENVGLKKDIKEIIKKIFEEKKNEAEHLSIFESEIVDNEENFYNTIYSGSLFGNKKIITIFEATDKITQHIINITEKNVSDVLFIIFAGILEKKSKLRNFFEKGKKIICIPCYLDNQKNLEIIAQSELRKNNISISTEAINLLIEKSNFDRSNLRNEIEKIKSYSLNKEKLDLGEIKNLINFSGEHKSDLLVNECLSGNISQFKKIVSELYVNFTNQILLLRVLSIKVQRLLNIRAQEGASNNLEVLINTTKPPIFWKEKTIVKNHLSLWSLDELKEIVKKINRTELLCKKNPQIAKTIFFNFFLSICVEANNNS